MMADTMTKSKIKLDADSFENVSRMLTSNSEEDSTTALMAMEQMDFKKTPMFFAILYRDSKEKEKLWEKHAPNLQKNIKGLGCDEVYSYRSIWNKLGKDASKEEQRVFLNRFSLATKSILTEWGFHMMKDFELIIKLKDDK